MEFIIFWFILSVLVGVYASSKKRSGIGYFFLSLIISPVIGFLIVLIAGPASGSIKKCPKCAEEIKVEAQVCRFCRYEFPINPPQEEKKEPVPIPSQITQETIDQLWRQRDSIFKKKWD